MLITETMRILNEEMHGNIPRFGTSGGKNAQKIYDTFLKKYNIKEFLDYGCGKDTLRTKLAEIDPSIAIASYDPCVFGFQTRPEGTFQAVVCHDVLEHVEYGCIEAVLDDIKAYGRDYYYFSIGTSPSTKYFSNGQSNHLIVEHSSWWRKFMEFKGFEMVEVIETELNQSTIGQLLFVVVCKRKADIANG